MRIHLKASARTVALWEAPWSMASALRAAGGEVTTAEIPGEDHMSLVMHLSRPRAPVLSELMTFIERHP